MSLHELFTDVAQGRLTPEEAAEAATRAGFENIGCAHVDHDRERRCGFPEVIFAERKTPEQVVAIAESLVNKNTFAFATRVPDASFEALRQRWPDAEYNTLARTALIGPPPAVNPDCGCICVVAAGTSDLPVAEEALVTIRAMGVHGEPITDVGVAGLHRILAHAEVLRQATAVVVVAGMEGALPSVVGGLVPCPVIAVPTSVGYGASFGGIAALLGMLNSCAAGVCVVNIDNGFGGGAVAARIAHSHKRRATGLTPAPEENA